MTLFLKLSLNRFNILLNNLGTNKNIKNLTRFKDIMHEYMIEHNLKRTSKLSINQIREFEREINLRINPEQKQDELFYR